MKTKKIKDFRGFENKIFKQIKLILLCLLMLPIIVASSYDGYDYYVFDRVSGSNLEVMEFDEELGIIENLIYSDMIRRNSNRFNGDFSMGIIESEDKWIYDLMKPRFYGSMTFDGGTYIKYELIDFELEDTMLDEYGVTEAYGKGKFKYKMRLTIEKEIPVEVYYSFFQDVDDRYSFGHDIEIKGENLLFEATDENFDKPTYRHNRRCYKGCEE